MSKTPEEIAYWKKVYPETDGNPPEHLLSEYCHYNPPSVQPTNKKDQEKIMDITGYIEDVQISYSAKNGEQRKNLCITLREERDPNPLHGTRGAVVYIKSDIADNVEALLAQDPQRQLRYAVKADTYITKREDKSQPGKHYHTQYNRAWSFAVSE